MFCFQKRAKDMECFLINVRDSIPFSKINHVHHILLLLFLFISVNVKITCIVPVSRTCVIINGSLCDIKPLLVINDH